MTRIKLGALLILTLITSFSLSGCTTETPTQADKQSTEQTSINTGFYEPYTTEKFKELLGSEKFILFFHADWCPTCLALEEKIKENLDKLNSRTVLEVNYDTENELKKEYKVTMQSTLVFIDSNGSVFETRVNPDFDLIEKFFY